jgi:hypothetical protein
MTQNFFSIVCLMNNFLLCGDYSYFISLHFSLSFGRRSSKTYRTFLKVRDEGSFDLLGRLIPVASGEVRLFSSIYFMRGNLISYNYNQ